VPYSRKILIYGGAIDYDGKENSKLHTEAWDAYVNFLLELSPVPDYLYLFDTKTLEYTSITENKEENDGAGPRFGHSGIENTLLHCNQLKIT
jgi:hypothetical protein